MLAPEFGAAFRRERKALGHTQDWVARQAGLTRFTVMQLESGHNVGLHHVLAALATLGKGLSIISAKPDFEQLKVLSNEE
ncbi:hypothetical protein DFQ28_008670 [Apophysomyces sp. BC1034]|nr:hypothetical protein DFQ30_009962 [Apophysomyces sp. BC1015]KAG0192548.1 hypothetical protein DFQ28_008670 [Apophysomyces sp. BC1034]